MSNRSNHIGLLAWVATAASCLAAQAAAGETTGSSAGSEEALRTVGLGAAAALAISISVLGASYAVARIGSAALGAAAEKPELLFRSILLVALAEGLGVLGFAIAMLLLQKI
jgi:V/A-type H+-transporting ATPase subunit K